MHIKKMSEYGKNGIVWKKYIKQVTLKNFDQSKRGTYIQ